MDNKNSDLADQILKIFLKEEVKIPYKIIEDKFEEFIKINSIKHEEANSRIEYLENELKKSNESLESIKKRNLHLSKIISDVQEEYIKKGFFEEFIENNNKKMKNLFEEIQILNGKQSKSQTENLVDINCLYKHVKKLLGDKEEIENSLNNLVKEFRLEKELHLNSSSSEMISRKQFEEKVYQLISQLQSKVDSQKASIENMEKSLQKSLNSPKKEYLRLSLDIDDKFSKYKEAIQSETEHNKIKILSIQEKQEILQNKVILSKKSEKLDKEIEDFMKQVSYNAKQIAKINQLLEAK